MTPAEAVGRHIQLLRQAAGLTQEEFGRALSEGFGFAWKSRQTVSEIEAGRRRLDWEELAAVAAFFEVSPLQLILGPGSTPAYSRIRVGDRSIAASDWIGWWSTDDISEPPSEEALRTIDRLTRGRGLARPWSRLWRRSGGAIGAAFAKAREAALALRQTPTGPTFVPTGDEPLRIDHTVLPSGVMLLISLTPGEPYTARDEIEAEALLHNEKIGSVRRITRHEAYRLRQKEEG